jgi:hypothetical protein
VSAPAVLVVASLTADELRLLIRHEVRAAIADLLPAGHPTSERLLDSRSLADALGVSRATIARLAREGAPVACFVGTGARYELEAVKRWLGERGRQGTKATPSRTETIAGVRLLTRGRRP